MKKLLCLSMVVALCLVMAVPAPASAITVSGYPDDAGMEKLLDFWQQEAYDGLTNGEAVYDVEWNWPAGNYVGFGGEYPAYDGTYRTPLVGLDHVGEKYSFTFGYSVQFNAQWEDPELGEVSGTGYEYIFPDLYGDLDLSGTNLFYIRPAQFLDAGDGISTHIESVEADDCPELGAVRIVGQKALVTVSALGCDKLIEFDVRECACRQMSFRTRDIGSDLYLSAFGPGSVGAYSVPDTSEVYAYPDEEGFLGWYQNGVCVSGLETYSIDRGGRLTAVFCGDANDDGGVTASDALLILRMSMGMHELAPRVDTVDVNANGVIDSADALSVLRLAMGV